MSWSFVEISEDDGETGKILHRDFMPPHRSGYVRIGKEKVCMPKSYLKFGEAVEDFEVSDDDVWVMSHPKTGTTWTQEMVWCIANNLDFVGAKQPINERFPFLEVTSLFDVLDSSGEVSELGAKLNEPCMQDSVKYCSELKSPRFIKTHLPWHMLPRQIREGLKKPKIVYVARNAKDTCLSYFNHCKVLEGYTGNFEDFVTLFLGDSVCYTPFWPHLLAYWERRGQPNILFLKFEDMKKEMPSVILKTASFLGQTLSESQVETLAEHLSFNKMKVNPAVNYESVTNGAGHFMRKGEVDQWKADMSAERIRQFDEWTKTHIEGTGLPY